MIDQLRDHFIICGYGRVGRKTAEEFAASGEPFVVLDFSPEALQEARDRGVLHLKGSGAEDEDLERAGIDRARGVIASADSDAENLYITLSARTRQPGITIVARASSAEAERKLLRAGADRVVQPYSHAGMEIAKLALKPQVAAFLDLVTTRAGPDLRFEELEVRAGSRPAGRTLSELDVQAKSGAVVIALRRAGGAFDVTPNADAAVEAGDVLIAMGTEDELRVLEDLLSVESIAG
jgi:voltage-gated potassium channel